MLRSLPLTLACSTALMISVAILTPTPAGAAGRTGAAASPVGAVDAYTGLAFTARGYAVLSYTGLGFPDSGCKVSLYDPAVNGVAASHLVTFLGGGGSAAYTSSDLALKDVGEQADQSTPGG